MGAELTTPAQLRCAIVRGTVLRTESTCLEYVVTDENNIVVAEGTSSSPDWVRHDAGGYHTKQRFDEMFPQGWQVHFDF